jgi:hypothetical protein
MRPDGDRLTAPAHGETGSERFPNLSEVEFGAMGMASAIGVRTASCRLVSRSPFCRTRSVEQGRQRANISPGHALARSLDRDRRRRGVFRSAVGFGHPQSPPRWSCRGGRGRGFPCWRNHVSANARDCQGKSILFGAQTAAGPLLGRAAMAVRTILAPPIHRTCDCRALIMSGLMHVSRPAPSSGIGHRQSNIRHHAKARRIQDGFR